MFGRRFVIGKLLELVIRWRWALEGAESIAEALKVNANLQDLVLNGIFSDFVHLLFQ